MKKIYYLILLSIQILIVVSIPLELNASELLKILYGNQLLEAEPEWFVTTLDNPSPGYLRFDWPSTNDFSLLDNYGIKQYNYSNKISRAYFEMLSNGMWISPAETKFYLFDQNLNVVDSIPNPTSYALDFHEIKLLSNGHYLMLCVEQVVMDLSKIVDGGSINAVVLSSVLVETDRNGHIYWQWKALDHTKITDVTPDIDLTMNVIDFTHINSFVEDNDGNIIISIRHFDEISKIKKSTGDFIWRMGGSKCKNNEFTFNNDLNDNFIGFSHQHSITLLSNGNLLLFDNGNLKNQQFSRAVEYQINENSKSVTKVWEYRNDPDIYCPLMGNVQRFSNGNTLINWGTNSIVEVRPDNTKAYELTYQSSNPFSIYRAHKYITKMNAVSLNMNGSNNYSFNDGSNITGINLDVANLNGNGVVTIEKHNYAPPLATFADSNFTSIYPFRWVITQTGISSISGSIKLKANTVTNITKPDKISVYQRSKETSGVFQEISTSYNSSSNEIIANMTDFGEIVIVSKVLSKPTLISPSNNIDNVLLNGNLTWNQLQGASKYQLQVSYKSNFENSYLEKIIDNDTNFNYLNFESATKYYWRVRGINSKDTSQWSNTYAFTTKYFIPVELILPENNSTGIKLKDTLFWKEVTGAGFYWLQVSKDNKFDNLVINNSNINQLNFQMTNLEFDTQYFWRVKAYKNLDTGSWSEIRNFRTEMSMPQLLIPSSDSINIYTDVYFEWMPIGGAEYYKLEVSETNLFNPLYVSSENIYDSHIVLQNFENNKKYFWRVKAFRASDSSEWSQIWNFNTLLEKPKLTYPQNHQSNLSVSPKFIWNKLESAATYMLQISAFEDFNLLLIDTNNLSINEFIPTELPPNKDIYWRVKAVNGNKHGDWSDTWSFSTDKGLLLVSPKLNSPKNNSESNISGDFIWTKVDKALTYSIQVSLTNDFKQNIINTNNLKNNYFHYSGLDYDKVYYWQVKAFSLYDSSQFSEIWMIKTLPFKNIATLLSPGNDELQVPVDGQLSWEPITEINYYELQLAKDSNFNNLIIDTSKITTNNFNYKGLEQNNLYYWRVRFKTKADFSQWSEIWSFTTIAPYTLNIPVLKNPSDKKIGAPINGALSWVEVPKAETYQISLSKNRNFSSIYIKNSEIVEPLFLYSKLEYNQTYFWRVSAVAENSKSSWSEQRSFLTELEPPVIIFPENNATDLQIDDGILWTIKEDVALYHVQIAKDSTFQDLVNNDSNLYQLNFTFNLDPNTSYYCRVKSYNDSNQSKWSKTITFKTGLGTSVISDDYSSKTKIYPNPAFDEIIISNQNYLGYPYFIYSLEGTEILKGIINSNSIDINKLNSGIYYLKIGHEIIKFIRL